MNTGHQVIVTKWLGPTTHKGSRVKAICAAGSATRGWSYHLSSSENHVAAARELMNKLGWHGELIGGDMPRGNGCAFVILRNEVSALKVEGRKVFVTAEQVAGFNRSWPCSELRPSRSYWFEFDERGDLVDTDCPEQDDGTAAAAMAEDCKKFLFDEDVPAWS